MRRPTLNISRILLPAFVIALVVPVLPGRAESLKERQAKVLEVVGKASPAVVAISGRSAKGSMGSGSGVIISKEGLILTAGHVLAATGDELWITLPGGREVKGKALGRNMNRDAAMAQISEPGEYPFVEMAMADSVKQGEWVLALGHPGGFDGQRGAPLRVGRLWESDSKTYYRSDCTVSGGDSGGPLFDLEGKVVGIHSSISQNLSENRHVPIGVFAKDMDRLKKGEVWGKLSMLMPGLREPEETDPPAERRSKPEAEAERPAPRRMKPEQDAPATPSKSRVYLGVTLENKGRGVQVFGVADGSPAAKAGLELEDTITKINGLAVQETDDVVDTVIAGKPGDMLKLTVKRGDTEKEIEVTLTEAP
jgi:serine protease Do